MWSHLEPFGVIWSHLEPFGAMCSQFEQFGAIWSSLLEKGRAILSHLEPIILTFPTLNLEDHSLLGKKDDPEYVASCAQGSIFL